MLSSEIVENCRIRSRSPGSRVETASIGQARQREREPDRADGLAVLLVGAGDPGGGDADVRAEHPLRALGHLLRALLAHDAFGGDPQHRALHLGGVRRDRTPERAARPRTFAIARADQAAGQRLRDAEGPAARFEALEHRVLHRLVVDREDEVAEDRAELRLLGLDQRPRLPPRSRALAVSRTTMPSIPRARNAIVGLDCVSTRLGDHLGQPRLGLPPGLERPAHDGRRLARAGQQVREDVVLHHQLHLVRDPGDRVDDLAADLGPDAGRGADRVRDHVRALRHVGLAQVVLPACPGRGRRTATRCARRAPRAVRARPP